MRIGLNLLPLMPTRSGGIEWYARGLVQSLIDHNGGDQLYLFTNPENHDSFGPDRSNVRRVLCRMARGRPTRRVIYEQVYLPHVVAKLPIEVFHSPFYTWPLRCTRPGVVTICDMLYRTYPRWVGRPRLVFWRVFVPLAAKRCRRILTISENSRRDIVRFLRVPLEKVIVTPLAADPMFATETTRCDSTAYDGHRPYENDSPYILSVGGIGPHKNTVALVRAFHKYCQRPRARKLTLVLAGSDYGSRREVEDAIASLGLSNRVKLVGYVPRRDLPALYRGALLYVSVSLFEGFGLTPLEAMTCGVPVIVSNRAALPEVVGDAGITVEPDDVDGVAEAIWRVTSDEHLQRRLSRGGILRTRSFSWAQTAQRTLEAYRAAAGV